MAIAPGFANTINRSHSDGTLRALLAGLVGRSSLATWTGVPSAASWTALTPGRRPVYWLLANETLDRRGAEPSFALEDFE